CYKAAKAKAPKGQPSYPVFAPRVGLDNVTDQFGATLLDLKKSISLCNPADENGDDPSAPSDVSHIESYKATLTKTVPAQPRFTKSVHTVQNPLFGSLKLKVNALDRMMVPSAKVIGTTPPASYTATDLDHFKCYKVSVSKETGNVFAPASVQL